MKINKDKIIDKIDDEIYSLIMKIQKKYNLTWKDARNQVNYAIRVLMLSYPEKWLKK